MCRPYRGPMTRMGAGVNPDVHPAHQGTHAGVPLPTIMQWFKTMTTNEYLRGVKTSGWAPFQGRLWQRNYYEHIIRDERELNAIRRYIQDNPRKWRLDRGNMQNIRRLRPPATTDEYMEDLVSQE